MKIENLNFSYENKVIFNDFCLETEDGKTTCIMANSGIGKTTLLNIIAGILKPDSGSVNENIPVKVSYIFQEPRLLPSLTVFENVFAVNGDKEKVEKILKDVELFEAKNLYPSDILLMDEPFKGLDIGLKTRQISLLKKLLSTDRRTVLTVTHDVDEAFDLADRIIVLDNSPAVIVKDIIVNRETKEEQKKDLKEFLTAL